MSQYRKKSCSAAGNMAVREILLKVETKPVDDTSEVGNSA